MKKRVSKWEKYEDPEILRAVLNSYFDEQDEAKLPYTISGICLQVGCRRKELLNSDPSTPTGCMLYQARMLIEQQHEIHLLTAKRPAGVVFALKNLGWSETSKVDVGFSNSSNANDPDALKWTVEIVAPGQVSNSDPDLNPDLISTPVSMQEKVDEIRKLNPRKLLPPQRPASAETIEMKPLRTPKNGDSPDTPKPWFVSAFEEAINTPAKKPGPKPKKVPPKPEPKFSFCPVNSDRMTVDIRLKNEPVVSDTR